LIFSAPFATASSATASSNAIEDQELVQAPAGATASRNFELAGRARPRTDAGGLEARDDFRARGASRSHFAKNLGGRFSIPRLSAGRVEGMRPEGDGAWARRCVRFFRGEFPQGGFEGSDEFSVVRLRNQSRYFGSAVFSVNFSFEGMDGRARGPSVA
jgi:hypothetical protein